MTQPELRRDSRLHGIDIPAQICGRDNIAPVACRILDFSRSGCRVAARGIEALHSPVTLSVDGLVVHGVIVWHEPNLIGVMFRWHEPNATEAAERRREQRKAVSIASRASDRRGGVVVAVEIVDASTGGCQIASAHLDRLPDEIILEFPPLRMSVVGTIRWRHDGHAGVQTDWSRSVRWHAL